MNYNNIRFFISVICMSQLMRYVSALNPEGIANGKLANVTNFPYQAAIVGAPNHRSIYKLLCSGAIVSSSWILSVAHCFMSTSYKLKNLTFLANVGSSHLTVSSGLWKNILYIYTKDYNASTYVNDITMAKTDGDLILSDTISEIGIASPRSSFLDRAGQVSGYGSHEIQRRYTGSGNDRFVRTDTDHRLRNITVTVKSPFECSRNFPFIAISDKFCGVAEYIDYLSTGVCSDDAGSPLVIDDKIVGLSSSCYYNCFDTYYGSLYIDVPKYFNFIEDVKIGNYQNSWLLNAIDPMLMFSL